MSDATVKIGDYVVPLIGIPESASLEMCDLCGIEFPLREIKFTGIQFLCWKCSGDTKSVIEKMKLRIIKDLSVWISENMPE